LVGEVTVTCTAADAAMDELKTAAAKPESMLHPDFSSDDEWAK